MKKNCGSGGSNKIKTKLACILGADESTREIRYRIIMKTILQEKEDNSLQHYNLVHKFIPMPQSCEISCSKSSGGQGMGKLGENFGVEPDESQKQIRGRRAQKFTWHH